MDEDKVMQMYRRTRKDCVEAAKMLAEALGKQFGNCWELTPQGSKAKIGCWDVDYNPTYGGAVVKEIVSKEGGITYPLSESRLPPDVFCEAMYIARRAVEISKNNHVCRKL